MKVHVRRGPPHCIPYKRHPVTAGMATDFRDGKTFPRRGREPLGEALWLARLFDKARAAAGGTLFDYIYPCPMDKGVMERWGITPDEFDAAIETHPADDTLYRWLLTRSTPERIRAANDWLLNEKVASLDKQDSEESATI
jgi:hypothetical protein